MFNFFANIFGYLLNFIYNFVNNYGLAMIIFTLVIKIVMLPLSIKQQRMLKKSNKLQEKMNPFSGCLSTIIQFILLISIFYMVRCPLTYMKKVDTESINSYVSQMQEDEKSVSAAYPEIDIIREVEYLKEKNPEDSNIDKLSINMEFLGLDLSKIPQQNLTDWTVYIIPVLYIISSFVSIKLNNSMQKKASKTNDSEAVIDITEESNKKEDKKNQLIKVEEEGPAEEEFDAMAQTNKMMSWMIPIMSVSISIVAPLGLALYWLVNNITMIVERLVLNKIIKD